jgi:hypothetical protein
MNQDAIDRWKEIDEELKQRIPQFGKHKFQFALEAPLTKPKWAGELMALSRVEKQYVATVEAAIAEWRIGQPFRELGPDESMWLKARVQAAANFAWLHVMPAGIDSAKVLPVPACSIEEAIKFLLTGWWKSHGKALWYQSHIIEQYDEKLPPWAKE